ncbi:UNVERIFIED_CONTAM: hypothetical protein HDU68_012940 [Siphonaria sp. JEL0065]|nr:hypothetical protein HDU68_012940 [Siphonaria sp. JEL0065]
MEFDDDEVDYSSDHNEAAPTTNGNQMDVTNDNDDDNDNDSIDDLFGGDVSDDDNDNTANSNEVVPETQPPASMFDDEQGFGDSDVDDDNDRQLLQQQQHQQQQQQQHDQHEDENEDEQDQNTQQRELDQEQEREDEALQLLAPSLRFAKTQPPSAPGSAAYLSKVPAYLDVASEPYDAHAFAKSFTPSPDELEKLRTENTIRWRYADAASRAKDSNARVIRWSDGSFSLLLNGEVFVCSLKSNERANHFLAAKHKTENVLQNHLKVKSTVMFASSKTGNTHKRMSLLIGKKWGKKDGTRLFTDIQFDPVKERKEAEKRDREAIQAARKMQLERQKTASSYAGGSGGGRGGGDDRYSGRRYEEFSDDDGGHTAGRRRPTTNLDAYEEDFVEDDDVEEAASDSEDERRREEKLRNAKRSRRDDDEPSSSAKKSAAKRRVIDDSDDDE